MSMQTPTVNRLTADTFSRNMGSYGAARQGNLVRREGARQFDKESALKRMLGMRTDTTNRYMQQEGFKHATTMQEFVEQQAENRLMMQLKCDRETARAKIAEQKRASEAAIKQGYWDMAVSGVKDIVGEAIPG